MDASASSVVGNLKYATPLHNSAAHAKLIEPPYVLAASTHDDEELTIAKAWRALRDPGALLVIAPRHPERGAQIGKDLHKLGFNVARRSLCEPIQAATDIYLADTIGDMPTLLAHARWVFIGGSLIAHGGHNLLEAARAGKAILCGPYMDNFSDEVRSIGDAGGAIQLGHVDELQQAMQRINAPDEYARIGQRARQACSRHQDIAKQYASLILETMQTT